MKKLLAGVPALVLVGISLWEIIAAWRSDRSVPGDDAWRDAAQIVRAEYRAGDLIVFAPDWIDPVGRMHLGDLMPIATVARMDSARYSRIWELSIRGARSPDVAELASVATTLAGGVTVRRFERAGVSVVDDLVSHRPTTNGLSPTLELAEVGFAPHRCFMVTPQPGQPVRMTFAPFQFGSSLVGYVGLADVFTRRDVREPGTLSVQIGGRAVATVRAGVDDGWVRFAVATSPGTGELAFVASASAPQRKICFAAEARR